MHPLCRFESGRDHLCMKEGVEFLPCDAFTAETSSTA